MTAEARHREGAGGELLRSLVTRESWSEQGGSQTRDISQLWGHLGRAWYRREHIYGPTRMFIWTYHILMVKYTGLVHSPEHAGMGGQGFLRQLSTGFENEGGSETAGGQTSLLQHLPSSL